MFPTDGLEFEDFGLLEGFQMAYLPGWVPEEAFARCLHAHEHVARLLEKKHPPLAPYLARILREHGPARDEAERQAAEEEMVATCADVLIYVRQPEVYDTLDFAGLDYAAFLADRLPLAGARLLDVASGTGAVALSLAPIVREVFAVEPVGRLREHIRSKAKALGLTNVFVIDGMLRAVPLPDGFADVLIASQAFAWHPEEEVVEVERVVKPGGTIAIVNGADKRPILEPRGYREEPGLVEGHERLILYTKVVGSLGS